MNSHLTQQRFILGMISAAAVIGIIWKPVFGWHRPYVNWAPWDLAQYLADNERDPRECLDLISFEIMAPQQGEQRALCVFEYAKITKDPLACKLLKSGSYAMSCVGVARKTFAPCFLESMGSIRGGGIITTRDECLKNGSSIAQEKCCIIARAAFDENFNDCSNLKDSFKDQCIEELAMKKHDKNMCNEIMDENTQLACDVSVSLQ